MTSGPANVLMVTAWSPANHAGGVNTIIRMLSRLLRGDRSAHILVNEWDARHLEFTSVDGLELYSLRLRCPSFERPWHKGLIGWLRDFPSILVQLHRLLRENKIAIVHLHFASDYQYYFRILKFVTGIPYVVTFHRGDIVHFAERSSVSRFLTRWVVSGADRVTAVSKWLADEASIIFPDLGAIDVIYNGLDFDELEPPDRSAEPGDLNVEVPADFILIVSNVTYYKGQDLAIQAWGELKEILPDLHLVIVGEPRELWQSCEQLIRDLGCSERIHMLGPLHRDQVFALMRRARALLFPSRSEGLPFVVLEAGALGLPVICSDIPPFLEVVDPGRSALVVPREDPHAIAEAVLRLTRDPDLAQSLAQALQARVRVKFSAETMAQQYTAIYDALYDAKHKT